MNEYGETMKLNRFELEGRPMVDMRWWKDTNVGLRPTKKGIVIEQRMVTQMIEALWKMHESFNSEEARKPAGVRG